MNKIITFISILVSVGSIAQTQTVISNGGNYEETPAGSITWTIGEVSINTIESSGTTITQGFNQDWLQFVNTDVFIEKININVFPNPTTEYINIDSDKKTELNIYDISSKLVKSEKLEKQQQVGLSELAPGTYYLEFTRKNKKVKTIKIIIL